MVHSILILVILYNYSINYIQKNKIIILHVLIILIIIIMNFEDKYILKEQYTNRTTIILVLIFLKAAIPYLNKIYTFTSLKALRYTSIAHMEHDELIRGGIPILTLPATKKAASTAHTTVAVRIRRSSILSYTR